LLSQTNFKDACSALGFQPLAIAVSILSLAICGVTGYKSKNELTIF
jgi:hypothetical protein